MSSTVLTKVTNALARALSIDDVDQIGRDTGQSERFRTITPSRLFLSVVAALASRAVESLADLLREFNHYNGVAVAYKAFYNRLARASFATFMRQMLARLVEHLSIQTLTPAGHTALARFKDIVIQDVDLILVARPRCGRGGAHTSLVVEHAAPSSVGVDRGAGSPIAPVERKPARSLESRFLSNNHPILQRSIRGRGRGHMQRGGYKWWCEYGRACWCRCRCRYRGAAPDPGELTGQEDCMGALASTLRTAEDRRDGDEPPAVHVIYVVLDADHPLAPSSRHRLDGVNEVEIARGEARSVTREIAGGKPRLVLRVTDPRVSRPHAFLRREGDRWVIQDTRSTNGIRINGALHREALLGDGDVIELGHTFLLYRSYRTLADDRADADQ
ncbi:MAG TPA: FHA domain-containing protein, partial [Kofleriaceae bacterium]|nr:FHA domain-containing protein [Kofleriaceae bacterium]